MVSDLINHADIVKVLVTQSCPTLCDPMDYSLLGSFAHGFPGKNMGFGSHSLLQRIFPIQGSNRGLLHCRQIFYHLSHQGSPKLPQIPLTTGFRKLLSRRIFTSPGRVAHLNSMETETPALVILLDLALFILPVPLHPAVHLHPLYCPV